MPVNSGNIVVWLFQRELSLHCDLAKRAADRLQDFGRTLLKDRASLERGDAVAPLDIIETCHMFLLSAGVISKILDDTKNGSKKRAEKLRELMRLPPLCHLADRAVRNSFEHIDERLDRLSRQFKDGMFITPLKVDDQSTDINTIVLKRFRPREMCICFEDDSVDLNAVITEIGIVKCGIQIADAALNNLKEGVLAPPRS
jgi:hypothetical protein